MSKTSTPRSRTETRDFGSAIIRIHPAMTPSDKAFPINTGVTRVPNDQSTMKAPSQKKQERLALYERWVEIVRERVDFQALSWNRGESDLIRECLYLIQADFGTPGHLKVTLYIMSLGETSSSKTSHDDLRRARKIWLIPSFVYEKNEKGVNVPVGIEVRHDVSQKFSVDSRRAFITFDIETDAVPSMKELDRLFTRDPIKPK